MTQSVHLRLESTRSSQSLFSLQSQVMDALERQRQHAGNIFHQKIVTHVQERRRWFTPRTLSGWTAQVLYLIVVHPEVAAGALHTDVFSLSLPHKTSSSSSLP